MSPAWVAPADQVETRAKTRSGLTQPGGAAAAASAPTWSNSTQVVRTGSVAPRCWPLLLGEPAPTTEPSYARRWLTSGEACDGLPGGCENQWRSAGPSDRAACCRGLGDRTDKLRGRAANVTFRSALSGYRVQ
eukprot:scaffold784_cov399-Prasinococcus_capsulatus_cf.AAC.2